MEVIETLPLSIKERIAMEEVVNIPASWEEFYELFMDCEYRIEYYQNEIISMGFASDAHELIVANIIGLLHNFYLKTDYRVYGSNRLVYVESKNAGFNPDALVVKGQPLFFTYNKLKATTNPYLVVEVLSKSTYEYDLFEKLPCYKLLESLEYAIIVSQNQVFVSVYKRLQNNQWLNTDYFNLSDEVEIGDVKVLLSEIYNKITLPEISKK
jgi:Uma2 family endonuclease